MCWNVKGFNWNYVIFFFKKLLLGQSKVERVDMNIGFKLIGMHFFSLQNWRPSLHLKWFVQKDFGVLKHHQHMLSTIDDLAK